MELESQLQQAMDALQCPPGDTPVNVLSGGERRRVAMVKLLLAQPDLLLLDEPTNHLDAESVNWLEGHLKSYPGAVLAVTHDRYFLDNVAQWICEIDRHQAAPVRGQLLHLPRDQALAPADRGQRDAKRAKILERELEWVRAPTRRHVRPRTAPASPAMRAGG